MGVDKRAHLGALAQSDVEYKGRTVGVMGTGIDINYPNHHDKLFAQIIEQLLRVDCTVSAQAEIVQ